MSLFNHYTKLPNKGKLNVPMGTENAFTYLPIEEGDKMINFHNEKNKYNRYHLRNSFNKFPEKNKVFDFTINPIQKKPIHNENAYTYTAHLVRGQTRKRKNRRSNRRNNRKVTRRR